MGHSPYSEVLQIQHPDFITPSSGSVGESALSVSSLWQPWIQSAA